MVAKITHLVAYKRMRGIAPGVNYGASFKDPLDVTKWPDHSIPPPWERPVVPALLTSTELPLDELSEMDTDTPGTLEEPPAVATPPPAPAAAASGSGSGGTQPPTGARHYKSYVVGGAKVNWTIKMEDTKYPLLPTASVIVWNGVIGNIKFTSYLGTLIYLPSKAREMVLLSKLRLMLKTPGSMDLTKKNMDFHALMSFWWFHQDGKTGRLSSPERRGRHGLVRRGTR